MNVLCPLKQMNVLCPLKQMNVLCPLEVFWNLELRPSCLRYGEQSTYRFYFSAFACREVQTAPVRRPIQCSSAQRPLVLHLNSRPPRVTARPLERVSPYVYREHRLCVSETVTPPQKLLVRGGPAPLENPGKPGIDGIDGIPGRIPAISTHGQY